MKRLLLAALIAVSLSSSGCCCLRQRMHCMMMQFCGCCNPCDDCCDYSCEPC
ncbi:MAG: hypothetical protein HYS13_19520, partial [Planctomycetia bacterium]|nr:hypothetical protein [Planctomycetia bacterium]